MDITDKKIMFGFGSIDKVSQMIGKSDDDNVYFGYDDTSNSGIIVARGKLVSSSILDVYIINNTSTLGKVINVDYMSIDNEIKTLQIPVVDEDDLSDLIESLQSDYTECNSVTDSSNFVRIALKQEDGIITYLNVETTDIASKTDLDALAKNQMIILMSIQQLKDIVLQSNVTTMDLNNQSYLLTSNYLKSMSIGTSVNVMLVNSHKDNGYILGYNGNTIGYSTGFIDIYDIQNKITEIIDTDIYSYMFELIKKSDNTFNLRLSNMFGPTGSIDEVSWSTSLIDYTIKENDGVSVNSLCEEYPNNTCFTITNSDGYSLNSNGSASLLKFSTNMSEWSLWNIFKVNI